MKNKNGISMISLVITIIVIIILVSITYGVSILAIEKAEYAKFVNNLKQVQEAMDNANLKVRRETIVKGKVLTNAQIYNYIAKGGTTELDFVAKRKEPQYTIIEDNSNLDIILPEMKVNTPNKSGVKIKYAVTDDGIVFIWPPYKYRNGLYITDNDKVSSDVLENAGENGVSVDGKNKTILIDIDGILKNPTEKPEEEVIKTKIQKPTITGTYIYNGNEQTATLLGFDESKMTIVNQIRKNAGTEPVIVSLREPDKYAWDGEDSKRVSIPWTIEPKEVAVQWRNLSFEYDGKIHVPTAIVNGINGEKINVSVSGAQKDGGKYTATASMESVTSGKKENYTLTNTSVEYEIIVSEIIIKSADYTGVYDGNSKTIEMAVINPANGYEIYYSSELQLTASNYLAKGSTIKPTRTNAGETVVYYYIKANGGAEKSGSNKIEIEKANISPVLNMENYVYGGVKATPTITGNIGNGSVTYYVNTTNSVTGGQKWSEITDAYSLNAGKYYMYAVVDTTTNYKSATTSTKEFTVQKGTMSGSITIKGTTKYGETLTVDTQNIIPNNSTFSYTWWYSPSASATLGTKISDSTNSNTYKIDDGLIDKYIGVTVTATNENYEEKTFTDITDTTENGEGKVIRISITKPTKTSKTYSYNGKNQTLELNNYDSSLMSITNNSSTNAGHFTAVISLKNNNYMWSDSTISKLNINWSIEKIANTLSVTAIKNLKTTGGDLALVTASNAQGTVYYSIGTALTSSNYSSAGSTAIPTARTAGTYTVYYYTPGNTNYLEKSGNVQVTVTATTYTVTYNANGGSGAPANQSKILGTNLVLSSTVPTRSGYDFVSWNTKADGTGTSYNAGGTYTKDAPLTLYAIWKIKTVALSDTLYIGALSSYNNEPAATQTKTLELDLTNVKTLSFNTSGKWGYRNDIKATVSLIVNGTEYKKENIADGADNPVLHSFNWDVSSITGSATLQLYGYAKGGPAYYYGGKKFPAWQSNVGPLSVTNIVLQY